MYICIYVYLYISVYNPRGPRERAAGQAGGRPARPAPAGLEYFKHYVKSMIASIILIWYE